MNNQILYDPCPPIWIVLKEVVKTGVKIVKTKIKKIWNKYL